MILLGKDKKLPQNRIAKLRKEKNLSQAQLAKETGLTRQAISLYEIGKREPKLKTWLKLADFFDVPVTFLQGISNVSENQSYSSFNKWINKVKVSKNNKGQPIIPTSEATARLTEQLIRNFSNLSNAIINDSFDGIDKHEMTLKDNITNLEDINDVNFLTRMVFRILIEAKNGNGKAKIAYSEIENLVWNYIGLDKTKHPDIFSLNKSTSKHD